MDDNANEGDETDSSGSSSDQQHEQEALREAAAFYELQHSNEYHRFLDLSFEVLTYAAEVRWDNVREQLMNFLAMFDQAFAAAEELQSVGQVLFQPLEQLEVPVLEFTTSAPAPLPLVVAIGSSSSSSSSSGVSLEETSQRIARLVEKSQKLSEKSKLLVGNSDYLLGRSLNLNYYSPPDSGGAIVDRR